MTTQELKQYIDKVLGNNLRCLLPSYWWKRLFTSLADRVDEVEQSTSKLIESKVEEVKMPIVDSEDELSKLDLPKGSVAAVKDMVCSFKDLYRFTEEDFDDIFLTIYKKASRIERIAVKPYVGVPKDFSSCECALVSRNLTSQITFIVWSQGDTLQVGYYETTNSEAGMIKLHNADGSINKEAEEQLNSILKEREYQFVGNPNGPTSDEEYEILDSVFTIWEASELYIKGASWERLAKESDLVGNEGESEDDNSGVELRDLYIYQNYDGTFTQLTEEQKAWNLETLELVKQGKAIVRTTLHGTTFILELFNEDNEYQFGYTQFSPSGGMAISIYVAEDGLSGIKIEESHFDSELSTTSINAVQNKVIYENLYGMNQQYIQMYEEQNQVFTNAINNVNTELLKKVDYIAGKQLSTEDFTTALKTKLEGLSNYDDTSIQNAVNSLTTQINTLVSGDASAAIESFNEIIAFLNGVEDSESLDSIIASIEQQIAAKQDKLVSGTNIKTINGQSIVGSGNVVINADTSNLVTKEEFEDLTNEILDNEEVVASAFNDVNERINALAENVSGEAATKVELAESVAIINETINANDKRYDNEFSALDNRIDELAANVSGETVTKVEFEETITNLTNEILDNEEVVASAFNDVNVRINELAENVSGEAATKVELNDAVDAINQTIQTNDSRYAQEFSSLDTQIKQLAANVQGEAVTKTEFQETLSELNNEILDNEEVVASAINDLNARLATLEDIIATLQNS